MNPGKHQSNKQRGQDGGSKVHDHAHLLSFTHTLCMNYVITMCLLVSCTNTRNLLLFFDRFSARPTPKIISEQKPVTKNFAGFHNQPKMPILTYFLKVPPSGMMINGDLTSTFTSVIYNQDKSEKFTIN